MGLKIKEGKEDPAHCSPMGARGTHQKGKGLGRGAGSGHPTGNKKKLLEKAYTKGLLPPGGGGGSLQLLILQEGGERVHAAAFGGVGRSPVRRLAPPKCNS